MEIDSGVVDGQILRRRAKCFDPFFLSNRADSTYIYADFNERYVKRWMWGTFEARL